MSSTGCATRVLSPLSNQSDRQSGSEPHANHAASVPAFSWPAPVCVARGGRGGFRDRETAGVSPSLRPARERCGCTCRRSYLPAISSRAPSDGRMTRLRHLSFSRVAAACLGFRPLRYRTTLMPAHPWRWGASMAISDMQSGHKQQIDHLERVVGPVNDNGATLGVMRQKLGVPNAKLSTIRDIDGERAEGSGLMHGSQLLDRHIRILSSSRPSSHGPDGAHT
jgi:hypothetical protein